jgi:hypothetical protein
LGIPDQQRTREEPKYFGASKPLTSITNDDIAKLVSWRRGQQQSRLKKIRGKLVQNPKAPLVSAATVNRSTTEVLKKAFHSRP